jgi:hypothetical protein
VQGFFGSAGKTNTRLFDEFYSETFETSDEQTPGLAELLVYDLFEITVLFAVLTLMLLGITRIHTDILAEYE